MCAAAAGRSCCAAACSRRENTFGMRPEEWVLTAEMAKQGFGLEFGKLVVLLLYVFDPIATDAKRVQNDLFRVFPQDFFIHDLVVNCESHLFQAIEDGLNDGTALHLAVKTLNGLCRRVVPDFQAFHAPAL